MSPGGRQRYLVLAAIGLLGSACGGQGADRQRAAGPSSPTPPGSESEEQLLTPGSEAARELGLDRVWTGDFDGMAKRRLIRALVAYSKTNYFVDRGTQRGITYEALKLFEEMVNKELGTGELKVHVVIIPVARDRLLPALAEGRGDIAAANLTITPERRQVVDFSAPFATGVREIVVSGPGAPAPESLEELAGRELYVRPSSSYYQSLSELNASFARAGRPAMTLRPAEEYLEDEDLLEMVNAGLVPLVVVDQHKAALWAEVFEAITLHPDLAVRTGGEIAWAFRQGSPQLAAVVNRFVAGHKQGTLLFNILAKRYFKSTKWVKNALSEVELERFRATVGFFREYADKYGFDHLMMVAQGFQESGLDQSVVSAAGAVGIMQLLPSTAASSAVGISEIHEAEKNVHAGIKYMRWILDHYLVDEEVDALNKTLFAFASYNAGPNRIARLRREAAERGLDPNVWFRNVEILAVEQIGRETAQYVSNIYKYWAAYRLIGEQRELKERAREGLESRS